MNFNSFTGEDLRFLKEVVGEERVSTGQSNLELHSMDETHHKGFLPDVVVWPKSSVGPMKDGFR